MDYQGTSFIAGTVSVHISRVAPQDADDLGEILHRLCGTTTTDNEGEQSDEDSTDPAASESPWQNPQDSKDVNGDGAVSPLDAINELVSGGLIGANGRLPGAKPANMPFLDVNGDGFGTVLDVLIVINELKGRAVAQGESATAGDFVFPASIAAHYLRAAELGFAADEQDAPAAFACSLDNEANVSSNHIPAGSLIQPVMNAPQPSKSHFLAPDNDDTEDTAIESILNDIASDLWEHWKEVM